MDQFKNDVCADYMAPENDFYAGKEFQEGEGTNLLVNYMPGDMQEPELYKLFCGFGPLRQVKIIRDPETRASNCYGFVNYTNPMNANRAMYSMNGFPVRGKKLKVSMARPSSENIKNANIYVGNLPLHYNEARVREIFERFGNIVDLNLLRHRYTNLSRGIAFVRYELRFSVEKAILALNDFVVERGHPPLHVRLVKRPNEWSLSKSRNSEHDEPMERMGPAYGTPYMAQRSADTRMDWSKDELNEPMNSKCFVYGNTHNPMAMADQMAASSSKSVNYNYSSGRGRGIKFAPRNTPAVHARNEVGQVGLAGGIIDNSSEMADKCFRSSLDTGMPGKDSNDANNLNRNTYNRRMPYNRY